jgi:hypothetical protein
MKKLGWKAIGYALWIFGMFQLVPFTLGLMSQPSMVKFNLGVIFLMSVLGSMIYAFVMLLVVGKRYIDYLETKNQE